MWLARLFQLYTRSIYENQYVTATAVHGWYYFAAHAPLTLRSHVLAMLSLPTEFELSSFTYFKGSNRQQINLKWVTWPGPHCHWGYVRKIGIRKHDPKFTNVDSLEWLMSLSSALLTAWWICYSVFYVHISCRLSLTARGVPRRSHAVATRHRQPRVVSEL